MTDKELLEAAAKASGRTVLGWYNGEPTYAILDDESSWNPLLRDGEALRLAVILEMDVFVRAGRWTEAVRPMGPACKETHGGDPMAATRRAIVRAAAEGWKAMP